jgi:hypothetical protein
MKGAAALVGLVVVALGGARPAVADAPLATPAAFELAREAAPLGRVELGFDGGAPLDGGWAVGARLGVIDRPLTLAVDGRSTVPVLRRATLALGAALRLGEAGVVDVALPLAWQHGDGAVALGGGALDRWVVGDLAIGARLAVAGDARRGAFIRGGLTLPTGDERAFAGEPRYALAWQLIGRATVGDGVVLAATGGLRLRGAEVAIGDRVIGDELFGAAGVVVPVWTIGGPGGEGEPLHQLRASAEVAGVLGDSVGASVGPSPVEVRGGVSASLCGGWSVGVRGGRGVNDQIGAVRWRGVVEVAWAP